MPAAFAVEINGGHAVPVASKDGAFAVPAPSGAVVVNITGPGFIPRRVDARVEDGERAELGTITVEAGRSVSGRVLDAAGAPVAGATVAAGSLLSGGGAELYIESESIKARSTVTDADGRYVLSGYGRHVLTVVGGKDGVGRSASVTVPRGPDSAVVDLVLQTVGGVDGRLTRDGQPLADTVIIANPIGATASNFFVVTGPDGSFAFDALTAGPYVYLGAPHLGTPLEQVTNLATHVLGLFDTTATRVVRDLLNTRSAGVKDLRFGNLVDSDFLDCDPDELMKNRRVPVPWLATARHHRVVGQALAGPGTLGDGMVRPDSAAAVPRGSQPGAPDPTDVQVMPGLDHFDLARHPAVYEHIERWVTAGG